jgi:phospholipid transport system transporter-binding protein
MTAPYFRVESDTTGAVLRATGAISFGNAGRALTQMPQEPRAGTTLDLDLAALENADSATLAVLIAWSASARRHGANLRYRGAPPALRRLARLCEVDGLLGLN